MSYLVKAGTGSGCDYKDTRASTDGKNARLWYEGDDPASGSVFPPSGETGGDYDLRTSKWHGDGQKARH